jgi:hypothetical protein
MQACKYVFQISLQNYCFVLSPESQGEKTKDEIDNKDPITDVPEYSFSVIEDSGQTSDNRYI